MAKLSRMTSFKRNVFWYDDIRDISAKCFKVYTLFLQALFITVKIYKHIVVFIRFHAIFRERYLLRKKYELKNFLNSYDLFFPWGGRKTVLKSSRNRWGICYSLEKICCFVGQVKNISFQSPIDIDKVVAKNLHAFICNIHLDSSIYNPPPSKKK